MTKHFSINELTKSMTATRLGINNIPSHSELANLTILVGVLLQPFRDYLGKPLRVNSGYRSPALNKAIGGSANSQHCKGQAVDFECPDILDNMKLANIFLKFSMDNKVQFDQIILECYDKKVKGSGWIHVSYVSKNNRNRRLLYDGKNYIDYGTSYYT